VCSSDLEVVPCLPSMSLGWDTYRPALAVDLHGGGPQSHRILLETRPARLLAFSHPSVPQSWHGPIWHGREHEVRRWCRLLDESGIPADETRLDVDLPARPFPAEAIGATLIHPGAASASRRWPAPRWADVAAAERADGRTVLLTGNRKERPLALAIAGVAGLPKSAVWAGRTDVLALAALVRHADRVVCGDTGVAHLATAFRTPSVLLFGPTAPSEWGPPAYRPWHRVLWYGTYGERNGSHTDPGLLRITVDEVLLALRELPSRSEVQDALPAGRARARPMRRRDPEPCERRSHF